MGVGATTGRDGRNGVSCFASGVFDFRNNVIYNWGGNNASVFGQFALNSPAFGNVVNVLGQPRYFPSPTAA